MTVGETYLGVEGPFKGLYFRVIARDDDKKITIIRTALYEKVFNLSDDYVRDCLMAIQVI